MPTVETSVAAATAVVGYDLYANNSLATIATGQRVTGVALKGSAAAGDSKVRFTAGTAEIASIYNNNTGFPGRDDLIPVDYVHLGPPARLYATVEDAPATNPLNALIVVSQTL